MSQRGVAAGWRSARVLGSAEALPIPAPSPRRGRFAPPAAVAAAPAAPTNVVPKGLRTLEHPWTGVEWSLIFVALLVYIFTTVSTRYPGAGPAMGAGIIGLAMLGPKIKFPPFMVWFFGFLVWASIGYTQSPYAAAVADPLVTHMKVFVIALVAANALRTWPQVRFYLIFFLATFALYPVRGAYVNYFITHYTLFGRAIWNQIYGNPNDLAAFVLLPFAMVIVLLQGATAKWVRFLAVPALLVLPLLILLTQSRGVAIGFCVMVMVLIARHPARSRIMMTILAVGLIAVPLAPDTVWSRFSGLQHATGGGDMADVDAEGSAKQRLEILKIAVTIAKEHPAFGVGFGAYSAAHFDYAQRPQFDPTGRGPRDTHNTYVNVLAETGVPGLILFIGLVLSAVIPADRIRRRAWKLSPLRAQQLLLLELSLLAYLIAGVWGSYGKMSFFYLHLVLIWALAEVVRKELDVSAPVGRRGRR